MKWDNVIEIPPWGVVSTWNEANSAIRHLITLHKESLGEVVDIAAEIRNKLMGLFPFQDELLNKTCVCCQSPCCVTATVWIDYCDLLFLHLTDQFVPKHQLIEQQPDSCRYHSDNGCIIPRLSRPWVCTLYLCPPQMALLRGGGAEIHEPYNDIVQSIKKSRKKLEQLFILMTS